MKNLLQSKLSLTDRLIYLTFIFPDNFQIFNPNTKEPIGVIMVSGYYNMTANIIANKVYNSTPITKADLSYLNTEFNTVANIIKSNKPTTIYQLKSLLRFPNNTNLNDWMNAYNSLISDATDTINKQQSFCIQYTEFPDYSPSLRYPIFK